MVDSGGAREELGGSVRPHDHALKHGETACHMGSAGRVGRAGLLFENLDLGFAC